MITVVVAGPIVAALLWHRAKRRAGAARLAAMDAGLPMTIDLIVVVLGSGGTIHRAVTTVAEFGPEPVRQVFERVLGRSVEGMLLADSLEAASAELTAAFHPLVGALIAADRGGGSVSALLQRLADDADQARRWQLEALAKRLPVALLLPLVLCSLPAVVIGALVPLVIVALRQLAP